MVREIVHVSVGQCGIQMGNQFWNTIRLEHCINEQGQFEPLKSDLNAYRRLDQIDVFFAETQNPRKYVPRACLVDLEPGIVDVIKASQIGGLFNKEAFCFGASGAGNNYAKGHYTEGAELIDEAIDIIRKEAEKCECPQAFQMTHSIGGGTGSGLGTLILLKIRDNYPDRITSTYTVFPSPKVSDVVVEPYNAVLAMNQLLDNVHETFVIDNDALFNISHNVLKQRKPTYAHFNWIASMVMSGCTACLRFPVELNAHLRKLGINMVPFPRLHFFLLSQAPLFAKGNGSKINLTVQEITDQMWSSRNFLANVKSEDGKYLSSSSIYRGNIINYKVLFDGYMRQIGLILDNDIPMDIINLFHKYYSYGQDVNKQHIISTHEVEDESLKFQQKMADHFIKWIPDNIKKTIVNVPSNDISVSGTFVANTTAIKGVFQRIEAQFTKMYKRRAFLHWGRGEGMDLMEYQEADKNVRDLITEYQDKQDAVVDLDDDEDEEESEEEEEDGDEEDV